MKTLRFLMLALLLPVFVMTGCDKGGEENPGDSQIELPNDSEKTQQAFADGKTTGGFTFTAKQAWTATVTETGASRANNVEWLRLLLNDKETYTGAAGNFTLVIELDENYSGKTRTATITIKSGNDTITITVTQDGKTEDGTVPVDPLGEIGIPVAGSRLVSKIVMSGGDEGTMDFTYDNKNRLVKIKALTMQEPDVPVGAEPGEPYLMTTDITLDYSLVSTGVFKTTYMASSKYGDDGWTINYNLGSSGYCVSGTVTYIEGHTEDWTGIYNSEGYLIKSAYSEYSNDITWTGGNMTKVSHNGQSQTDCEYGNVANNPLCNIDLNSIVATYDYMDDPTAAWVGLLGKRSVKMVSKYVYVWNSNSATESYTYETDSQGFVTKITMDDGGIEKSVMTITYR